MILRPAILADSERIRLLRNDPEALFWSGNKAPIGHAEHAIWFEAALLQPEAHHIIVAEEDEHPDWSTPQPVIGYARFEVKPHVLVSFAVAPDHRGKGCGSHLLAGLEAEARTRGLPRLTARVHMGNTVSLRAFMHQGYVLDRACGEWQIVSKDVK